MAIFSIMPLIVATLMLARFWQEITVVVTSAIEPDMLWFVDLQNWLQPYWQLLKPAKTNSHCTSYELPCHTSDKMPLYLIDVTLYLSWLSMHSCREDFLKTFLHSVWEAKDGPHKFKATSPYCKFDSQILSLFQSSMYLAGEPCNPVLAPIVKSHFSFKSIHVFGVPLLSSHHRQSHMPAQQFASFVWPRTKTQMLAEIIILVTHVVKPSVEVNSDHENKYCLKWMYLSGGVISGYAACQIIDLLTVFIDAAFLASFAAAYVAKLRGRKMCMILAGLAYIIGVALTTGAVYKSSGIIMLVLGRCALGVGVGFGNAVSLLQQQTPHMADHWCKKYSMQKQWRRISWVCRLIWGSSAVVVHC